MVFSTCTVIHSGDRQAVYLIWALVALRCCSHGDSMLPMPCKPIFCGSELAGAFVRLISDICESALRKIRAMLLSSYSLVPGAGWTSKIADGAEWRRLTKSMQHLKKGTDGYLMEQWVLVAQEFSISAFICV